MAANEETYKGMGYMCCGPWFRRGQAGFHLKIGILLILIGSMWYGARMGWFDFTWFYRVPFWPAVVIIVGAWMVYRGLRTRRTVKSEHHGEE
jgi:ABC-type nickel/cobalt efflux system permease component RcnA